MSNWCYNVLQFKEHEPKLINEFKRISDLNKIEQLGQKLFDEGEFLFDIDILSNNKVQYSTRWNPNKEEILKIGLRLTFEFEHYYEELANGILGQVKYLNGNFYERELTDDDFDLVKYNDNVDEEQYEFDGKTADDPNEFYQEILENKEWELL